MTVRQLVNRKEVGNILHFRGKIASEWGILILVAVKYPSSGETPQGVPVIEQSRRETGRLPLISDLPVSTFDLIQYFIESGEGQQVVARFEIHCHICCASLVFTSEGYFPSLSRETREGWQEIINTLSLTSTRPPLCATPPLVPTSRPKVVLKVC